MGRFAAILAMVSTAVGLMITISPESNLVLAVLLGIILYIYFPDSVSVKPEEGIYETWLSTGRIIGIVWVTLLVLQQSAQYWINTRAVDAIDEMVLTIRDAKATGRLGDVEAMTIQVAEPLEPNSHMIKHIAGMEYYAAPTDSVLSEFSARWLRQFEDPLLTFGALLLAYALVVHGIERIHLVLKK